MKGPSDFVMHTYISTYAPSTEQILVWRDGTEFNGFVDLMDFAFGDTDACMRLARIAGVWRFTKVGKFVFVATYQSRPHQPSLAPNVYWMRHHLKF